MEVSWPWVLHLNSNEFFQNPENLRMTFSEALLQTSNFSFKIWIPKNNLRLADHHFEFYQMITTKTKTIPRKEAIWITVQLY